MQWTADENLGDARNETIAIHGSLPDVDLFAWWCNSGGGGVAGIAYLGGLCRANTGLATSLNEYQSTAASAGFVSFDFDANVFKTE